ncbi:uncharacterized protein LOC131956988 [Physella acuta]|uniref:uncharacterized protein LOC131956988 n=1 Tax=Physella acuta TaxID=109671 RepID=UPI0027DAEBEC|nr:uncharacterized protein LOC131956988 [Physella acuta]XP_059177657.1 uncharacterized protein LOC131956988 [Physella acuta]XP_059177658.1 uncharacterized protein LOC131956988 [Physella acuta]XP_059177659.1 uncharacterized protein LOC131956988 [Physella acuta]XP_059177660.1 uncharacterized protein LOC131956988 [Physella acuta]XP_059177662.1 uncharacterized protein LOC131956988 [Physella acuta]
MALQVYDVACFLLFAVELYHMLAHVLIMCGIRTLPRKDLVRVRLYFMLDTLTVFITSFLLTNRLKWLATLQIIQHLFYFITWDKSYMAKRIIDWSSLDWFKNQPRRPQIDSFLGTLFDVLVHAAMMYVIGEQMSMISLLLAMVTGPTVLYAVLFNSKFAWTSPNKVPRWIEKRVGKLALDEE